MVDFAALNILRDLRKRIRACSKTECTLHPSFGNARMPVPGKGTLNTRFMLIGEAPGEQEDKYNEPFYPEAESGSLLTKLLSEIAMERNHIYITNIAKCHPESNRDPKYTEMKWCEEWLEEEIRLVKPEVIIMIGRIAKNFLVPSSPNITKCHGQIFESFMQPEYYSFFDDNQPNNDPIDLEKRIYMPIYHPSYIKRQGGTSSKEYMETVVDLEQLLFKYYDEQYGWLKRSTGGQDVTFEETF
jgi:uracil-DNA glycosylase family 4